ncbi:hypothetical protein PQG22_02115 [Aquirufa beregesia]
MLPILPSTMRLKEKIAWFLAMGGLLFFHFYRLHLYALNFPNWGDDYAFLELLDYVHQHSWKENVAYIFHFHNDIHRIAYSRIWILIHYALGGNLNFKTAIILANVQMVLILIPFHRFLQKIKRSSWHLVGIACLLFAPFGNLDNFNLIGALQHTGSILFLVWIAYGLFYEENAIWVIILALFYPFVSTEGIAFLPMVGYVLWTKKSPLKIPFTLLALGVVLLYFHDYVGTASSSGQVSWTLIKGLFIFAGNWALPISDSFRAWFNLLAGIPVLIFFTWRILGSLRINITFPSLLFLQILATGFLICYGRASMGDLELIALSDRFLLYGNTMLVAIYSSLIIHKQQTLQLSWALLLSGTWIIASFFMARRPLLEMNQRWTADLLGAYYFQSSSAYECPPQTMQLLKSPYYEFDRQEIPIQFPDFHVQKTSQISPFISRFQDGRLSLSWNQLPEKNSSSDQRFLVLKQAGTPRKKYYIASLSNDYADRVKHSNMLIYNTLTISHFQVFLLNLPKNQYPTYQYLSPLTITN